MPIRRLEEWHSDGIVRGKGRPKQTWKRMIEGDMCFLGVDENMVLE